MAGTLSVQKIQGLASSATPTVVEVSNGHALHTNTLKGTTTAGSINVQGEGTATTNLQQGLLKNWCKFDGTGTVAIDDSFNTTSLTDNSAGNYTITIANDMGNVNYSVSGSNVGSGGFFNAKFQSGGDAHTATAYRFINRHESVGDVDVDSMQTMVAGDLA